MSTGAAHGASVSVALLTGSDDPREPQNRKTELKMIAKAIKMERDQWEPNWSDMGSQDEPGHDTTRHDTTRAATTRFHTTHPT